jgi:hypothetical protein
MTAQMTKKMFTPIPTGSAASTLLVSAMSLTTARRHGVWRCRDLCILRIGYRFQIVAGDSVGIENGCGGRTSGSQIDVTPWPALPVHWMPAAGFRRGQL